MSSLFVVLLLASTAGSSPVQNIKPVSAPTTKPVFLEIPPKPDGLTLYNSKGEIVAKCEKDKDGFGNCKMEPGVTLDDLMNAWVHAYEEVQK